MPTKNPAQTPSIRFCRPFINRIRRPFPTQKPKSLGESKNNINWALSLIATALALGIIYIDISKFEIPFLTIPLFIIFLASIYTDFPNVFSIIYKATKIILRKLNIKIDTATQALNFFLPPLFAYLSINTLLGEPQIPSDYHPFIILSTLIPLLPTLVYTFHKFHKPENRSINKTFLSGEKIKPQPPLEKLKSATQLVPIIISISFAFILIQNIILMDFDLGLAIHLTAIEFANNKYEWISFMLILILIAYSTFLPPLALSIMYGGFRLIQKSCPFKSPKSYSIHPVEQRTQTSEGAYSALIRTIVDIIGTAFHHFITIRIIIIIEVIFLLILGLKDSPSAPIYILLFSAIAYLNVNIYTLSGKSPNPAKVRKVLYSSCLKILMFFTIIFSILFHESTIISSIENSSLLGKAISSPSIITNSPENARFSCAFLDKPNSTESIAFGVIVSSKDSTIHIFSPSRNEVTGKYTHSAEDGKLHLNKLVETHVKVSEGYHIEKFNKSKHWFNSKRGSCNYRNEPPFYEYQQVKSKLIIRNIS